MTSRSVNWCSCWWGRRIRSEEAERSKLGESIQLDRFLERVQSWDYKHPPPDLDLAEWQHADPEVAVRPACSESGHIPGNTVGRRVGEDVQDNAGDSNADFEKCALRPLDGNDETLSSRIDTRGSRNEVNKPTESRDNNDAVGKSAALAESGSKPEGSGDTMNEASSYHIEHEECNIDGSMAHASNHTGATSQRPDYP
ncbi:hypothetical protein ON010_g16440 [Phytophthora cinnamomi]|nr:hypothetical protein ON010_g16440 [Phytophthora cinnamomi]